MAMQLSVVMKKVLLSTKNNMLMCQHMTFAENFKVSKVLPVLGIRSQENTKSLTDNNCAHELHLSSQKSYPAAKPLPLPDNIEDIDDTELACFSPLRDRDICGSVIMSTTDAYSAYGHRKTYNQQSYPVDPHVVSYDCQGALSLNSVMQSNVPEPFSSSGKSTHLNMPGGQWGQGHKYISEDMQNNHYSKVSHNHSGNDWQGISKTNYKWPKQAQVLHRHFSLLANSAVGGPFHLMTNRAYCTSNNGGELSRKDKLKRAVKEYGTTVVVFHVSISLLSLGVCYLAVTSGINVGGAMAALGVGSEVAAEAGQFVVAYAVHKVLAPVRISITLASTPLIVRYLRKRGFLKAPKPPTL